MTRTRTRTVLATAAAATAIAAVGGVYASRATPTALEHPPAAVLNARVTQATIGATICVNGWTATVRPPVGYTNRLKVEQMRARGLRGGVGGYEEDHAVSLELGGNPTAPANLYPEKIEVARRDDQVEDRLHGEVCRGEMSLGEARDRIWTLKKEHGL